MHMAYLEVMPDTEAIPVQKDGISGFFLSFFIHKAYIKVMCNEKQGGSGKRRLLNMSWCWVQAIKVYLIFTFAIDFSSLYFRFELVTAK